MGSSLSSWGGADGIRKNMYCSNDILRIGHDSNYDND